MCCGSRSVLNVVTTVWLAGSMTLTVSDRPFGTYTRGRSPAIEACTRPGPISLYTFAGSGTGGIPG